MLPLRARDLPEPASPSAPAPTQLSPFFAGLSYIGQLARTYLVCESAGELVLVDQHAAHERVAYARLVAAHGRREVRRQRLLFPLPIEVDEAAAAVAEGKGLATIEALGFEPGDDVEIAGVVFELT